MGPSERRDAYTILSLYISYFSKSDGCEDDSTSGDIAFDLRAEKEFWNEMKKGLVYSFLVTFDHAPSFRTLKGCLDVHF